MSMDRPQNQHDQPDHQELVEDERDGAVVQHAEPPAATATALPEGEGGDERDGAAVQEAERPAASATALPEAEGAGPKLIEGKQMTVPAERDAGPSPGPPESPTRPEKASTAHDDFQVFGPSELEGYRSRWEAIQLEFLDDPKGAAEQADAVVGELLGQLSERREALRDDLNRRSDQDVDTESMRVTVRNYRSLFQRLVGS